MAQGKIDSTDKVPLLKMQGVCKRFGATVALDDVGIEVSPGEVLALVGENGAGKSTLMKVLSGAVKEDTGQMWLDGVPYRPSNPLEARRTGVAMIYQEFSLAPHISVQENIMLGMEPATLGVVHWKEVRRRAIEALKEFDNPELTPGCAGQQIVGGCAAVSRDCAGFEHWLPRAGAGRAHQQLDAAGR